jgi:hypothetical protein
MGEGEYLVVRGGLWLARAPENVDEIYRYQSKLKDGIIRMFNHLKYTYILEKIRITKI